MSGEDGDGEDGGVGTQYRFVPYARRGFQPSDRFKSGKPDASIQPTLGIDITPKARKRAEQGGGWTEDPEDRSVTLSVYGPGDVQGLDTDQLARVEPEPDTAEFPANYFPFVEFDRPDLPWLFSPERGDDAGRTRPWLSLVVVTDDDTVDVTVGGNRPCPVLTFGSGADLASELPDLTESWAWAHVQAQGSPEGKSQGAWEQWLPDELQRTSNLTVSRVVSPRNLQPRTDYVAALVPTFAAGRLAGLGREPYGGSGSSGDGESGREGDGQSGDASPPSASLAWSLEDLPSLPFELPLYHYWRFTAGEEGTFEHLVRKLGPVELGPDVGRKSVDVRDPGPPSLAAAGADPTTDVGGALYSVPAKRAMEPYGKQERLRTLLNKPETLGESGGEDAKFPIVGPPLYGQWHAGLSGIPDPAKVGPADYDPRWFRQLNVNLRNRVAASVGANVVREHQNQLMDAAWEVVGEVREANEFTRAHQGVEAIGDAIESWRGAFDGGARGVEPPALSPWAVRRELERLERLGGIDPDVEGGVVDPTVVGGGAVDPAGGGAIDPVGGDPTGGDVLGGDGLPWSGGGGAGLDGVDLGSGTTQPLGPGVAGLGRRTRLQGSGLSRAYLDADRMERPLDTSGAPTTDGGAAAAPSPDDGTTKAAVYQQYLETFMAQPETSLQYQRLVRLDGPLGRKAEVDRTDYRQSLRRAARRAAAEVGTVSDGLLGGTPGDLPAGAKREPAPEGDDDRTGPSDTGGFVGPPDLGGLLGDGPSSSGGEATTPAAAADADQPPVGVADAERLRLTATEGLPRTRAIESRVASRDALDARVGGSDLEHGTADATEQPDDLPAVAALVESVVHHCDATDERVRRARRALGSDDPAGAAVLGAYETAQPIAYALDPLDRALSKAIADPSVTVPEGVTAANVDETVQSLWTAYADLLAALTEAHGAALAAEREREDGTTAGDAEEGAGDAPAAAPAESLATATARVDDIRDLLADLPGARAPGASTVNLPDTLAPRPASAVMAALDARRASTYGTDLAAIDGQLAARAGEGRYRRALLSRRLSFMSGEFVRSDDPVERVMVAPEFPTPMWRPLKDLDEEYLLPGADGVPQDSVGLVVQNREFIESYMVGLNHEMGRELLWRRYPTDRRGTYFRRFWNRGQGPAWSPESGFRVNEDVPSKDIEKIHEWDTNKLRCNAPGAQELDKVVLLVRGKLFKRYPNTVVYAARAKATERDGRMTVEPMTPERFVEAANPDPDDVKFPTFRGEVGSDMTFLGFDLTHDDVYADQAEIREVVEQGEVPPEGQNLGWYFVFEERPGETRFGFDAGEPEYAGTRPVGVVDDSGAPRYPREETSDGSRGARTPVEDEPVGWDGLSWYHLVDDPDAVDDASYVSVADSQPGDGDWAVEGNVGDVANYLEAPFDASDEATWGKNSAHMARVAFQKPVRVSFHAHELLPDGAPSPSDADYCE